MSGTLLGAPLGLWFGYDLVWGVIISWVTPSGAFIIFKINSLRYYQLVELLTLSLSPTWLIPTSGGRWGAVELSSSESITFALYMDEDSYRLTSDMSGLVNLLGPLVVWYSPSLVVQVNLLQDSSGVGVADDTVGFWLFYELGAPLGGLLAY